MREVEVKYRIEAGAAERVAAAAAAAGATWGPSVRQDDQAYAESDWEWGQPKAGRIFARLRTEQGRHLLTFKSPQSGELDCIESERPITDRTAEDARLRADGFRPTIRIVKTRRTAQWGPVTLCLDTVEDLGWFLEAEMIVADDQDGPGLQDRLMSQIASLGIEGIPVTETYDALLHRNQTGSAGTGPRAEETAAHR